MNAHLMHRATEAQRNEETTLPPCRQRVEIDGNTVPCGKPAGFDFKGPDGDTVLLLCGDCLLALKESGQCQLTWSHPDDHEAIPPERLLPCPFCGQVAQMKKLARGWWAVGCRGCSCRGGRCDTERGAALEWNRRQEHGY